MSEQTAPPLPSTVPDNMFPALTPAQQARVAVHGHVRQVERGETVVELNEHAHKFFVVVRGQLDLLRLGEGSIAVSFAHQVLSE